MSFFGEDFDPTKAFTSNPIFLSDLEVGEGAVLTPDLLTPSATPTEPPPPPESADAPGALQQPPQAPAAVPKAEPSPSAVASFPRRRQRRPRIDDPDVRPIKRPTVCNIVATVNMGVEVDCRKIAQFARNAMYNPKRFPAVILKIKQPQSTGFIFRTGKLTVLGTRTIRDAKKASRIVARIVQKIGWPDVKWRDFKVMNIVANCDVGFKVNLEALALEHAVFASYEPELFSGLVYRMICDPKVTLLIFHTGRIVCTSKSIDAIQAAFDDIFPTLEGFRLQSIMSMQ